MAAVPTSAAVPRWVAPTFTIAIFVNAALLFAVEPMFSKMALPLLGGTPAVWNTCMLFFQMALLGGYLYAHLTSRYLASARQLVLHFSLLALSLLWLPIAVARGFRSPPSDAPVPWLIALLAVSLGVPFFLLSSGAPLLQRWFARTGHPAAGNPYFLYAASNLGSLLALLAYPTLIERALPVSAQSAAWSISYGVLIVLIAVCAAAVWRAPLTSILVTPAEPPWNGESAEVGGTRDLTMTRRARWVVLAFVPSSMMLGVTTYLSTDIAAIPLLWVIPLALYLLTFVISFSSRVWFRPVVVLGLHTVFLAWLTMTIAAGFGGLVRVMAPAHLSLLFLSALVCHTALANDRPPAAHLTEFYLWIAFGGLLGGVFNVLIAPQLFPSVAEYPIAIVLSAALRPGRSSRAPKDRWLDLLLPLVLAVGLSFLVRDGIPMPGLSFQASLAVFVATCAIPCLFFRSRPIRLAIWLAAIFAIGAVRLRGLEQPIYRARSFFGVYTVARLGEYRTLRHGTTMHGAQSVDSARSREPLTYYHRGSPIAQILDVVGKRTPVRRIAVVGLGTGSLACYGRPNETITFYEIDPLVERIARTPAFFTYLRDCPPATRVIIGDARLALARADSGAYDLLVVDAFTSDAIPTHLLTREALAMYFTKLAPGGIVALHISNRYLDLEPVVSAVARTLGATALVGTDSYLSSEERGPYSSLSIWAAVAPDAWSLEPVRALRGWRAPTNTTVRAWTDDFTNVLGVFLWR